jgi:hypothetical protein
MPKSEYRLSITVSQLGGQDVAEGNMERFVEAFDAAYPDAGAVMAANYRLETLDATFSVDADDAKSATELGLEMFCDVADKTGIPPTEIVDIRTTLVAAADHELTTAEYALAP